MRVPRVVLLVFLAATAPGQKEAFVPANDVSFTIATEHRQYPAGERVFVRYEITNIGTGSVYVPREWDVKCPASPHIWAWFENGSRQHFIPGYAGDCSPSEQTIVERMKREAVLLKPGERLQGHVSMETSLFGGLEPGAYRVEAVLYGWNEKDFDEPQRNELKKMPASFIRGEVPASTRIILTR
ncbi:MAG: hypothetical protein ACJ72H_22460 [Candidatus Sulfotelmatobacter sp.]